jgi:hypothetical protein
MTIWLLLVYSKQTFRYFSNIQQNLSLLEGSGEGKLDKYLFAADG